MTTATATKTQLFQSGNKVIDSLKEAKGILDSAERWGKEDLTSISPFLTIIQGTVNDTKYRLAQITIHSAEEELHKFCELLSSFPLPVESLTNLKEASLPEKIKSKKFFESSLSHDEYEALKKPIDVVIQYVSDIMESLG